MKAFVRKKYGLNFQQEELDMPVPKPNEVQVAIHAISLNPAEWHIMMGKIWIVRLANGLFKPHKTVIGGDISGVITAIGDKVTSLHVGDRVFGRAAHSAFAEYACIEEDRLVCMPDNLNFEDAAALPLASSTAYDALHKFGKLPKGSRILLNGASGGIGTYAIQLAKAHGLIVHAICSHKNTDLVKQLGATKVFNYESEDLTAIPASYDLIIDLVGNLNARKMKKLLNLNGGYVLVGYTSFRHTLAFFIHSIVKQNGIKMATINTNVERSLLARAAHYVSLGKLRSVIDRVYPFESVADAFKYLGSRRASGKIVIRVK